MEVEPRIARSIVGAVREKDRSGTEIWRWLGEVHGSHSELTERTLYPILYSLEADGLIEGHWHEDGEIRWRYRLTSVGLETADANGWPAIARPSSAGSDDSSAWNFEAAPRRGTTAGVRGNDADGSGAGAIAVADPAKREASGAGTADVADAADAAEPPHGDEGTGIGAYLDQLERSLAVDDIARHDIRAEIADHLNDMALYYRSMRVASDDALEAAFNGLGSPDELAAAMNAALRTRPRLVRALRWGLALAPAYLLVAYLFGTAILVIATPLILTLGALLAGFFGLSLHTLGGEDLTTTTYVLTVPAALFLAARKSTTQVSLRAHRSERSLFRMWGVTGFVLFAPIALLLPMTMNPVVAICLAAAPVAWAAGCWRPITIQGESVTSLGMAIAVLAIAGGMILPGAASWFFRADEIPTAAPARAADTGATLFVQGESDSAFWSIGGVFADPARWRDLELQVWPAERTLVSIVPAPAAAPSVTEAGSRLDLTSLDRNRDWYILLTGNGADGSRRTLASSVIFAGTSGCSTNLAGWIVHGC